MVLTFTAWPCFIIGLSLGLIIGSIAITAFAIIVCGKGE